MTETSSSSSIDFISLLPPEIALHIFTWLDVGHLARAALVSQRWRCLAEEGSLWRELCRNKWLDKQYYSIEKVIQRERSSNVNTEKGMLSKSGSWIDWKSQYKQAETDSKRTRISKEELCSVQWIFAFQAEIFSSSVPIDIDSGRYPRFHEDYTYDHPGLLSGAKWRFIDSPNGDRAVQVQQFPALTVLRMEDWGWMLFNNYVTFTSFDPKLEERKLNELKAKQEQEQWKQREELVKLTRDLIGLSISELKSTLSSWGVDMRYCLEKQDLVDKALCYIQQVREMHHPDPNVE
jgi:hypothetical protein